MQKYEVGDTVVHWAYGSGKIVAVDDKGLPGKPCFYYVIEGNEQTMWVPVEESGRSSLHLPTSRTEFTLLINTIRSPGEELSNNPFQRHDQLDERMQKASPKDLCMVIRDLNYLSHRRKLSNNDFIVLKHAQIRLLDEWERSLGTSREKARCELEWIFKETPARQDSLLWTNRVGE